MATTIRFKVSGKSYEKMVEQAEAHIKGLGFNPKNVTWNFDVEPLFETFEGDIPIWMAEVKCMSPKLSSYF
jgi:hypothetical protein